MTTNSTDIDASGTLITTEFGGPPQLFPAGVPNYQGYNAPGQGIQEVYKYLFDPTDNEAPADESEGGLALQEQEWVEEITYLDDVDPEFIEGGEVPDEVVFENPLDTAGEDSTIGSDDTFTVFTDGDASGENEVNIPTDIGETVDQDEVFEEGASEEGEVTPESQAVTEANATDAEATSEVSESSQEPTEEAEPVVAPAETSEAPSTLHPFRSEA